MWSHGSCEQIYCPYIFIIFSYRKYLYLIYFYICWFPEFQYVFFTLPYLSASCLRSVPLTAHTADEPPHTSVAPSDRLRGNASHPISVHCKLIHNCDQGLSNWTKPSLSLSFNSLQLKHNQNYEKKKNNAVNQWEQCEQQHRLLQQNWWMEKHKTCINTSTFQARVHVYI